MSAARLIAHQFRYDLRSVRRNRQALVTTIGLPVLLLVLFVGVGGQHDVFVQDGHRVNAVSFFTPGLIAMGVVASAFGILLADLVLQRETGVLKRRRATPVPAWALIAGRTLTALATTAMTSFVLLAIAGNRYDLKITTRELVAVAVCVVFGTVALSALSYAIAPNIRSAGAIQPIVQLVLLPVYLISGVFLPDSKNAGWLNDLAEALPVEHIAHGLHRAFGPEHARFGLTGVDVLILSVWTVAALVVAVRRFAWLPSDRRDDVTGSLAARALRAVRSVRLAD